MKTHFKQIDYHGIRVEVEYSYTPEQAQRSDCPYQPGEFELCGAVVAGVNIMSAIDDEAENGLLDELEVALTLENKEWRAYG